MKTLIQYEKELHPNVVIIKWGDQTIKIDYDAPKSARLFSAFKDIKFNLVSCINNVLIVEY